MTASTPIYGLKYLTVGEPARNTRLALEQNAFTIEAALQAGGVAAAGASDLLAVSGRVSVIETARTIDLRTVTFASPWAQFTSAPYGEPVRVWKDLQGVVHLTGMALHPTGWASSSTYMTVCTLPVSYRPAMTVIRTAHYSPASGIPQAYRVHIDTAGAVSFLPHTAPGAQAWLTFDITFRTTNP